MDKFNETNETNETNEATKTTKTTKKTEKTEQGDNALGKGGLILKKLGKKLSGLFASKILCKTRFFKKSETNSFTTDSAALNQKTKKEQRRNFLMICGISLTIIFIAYLFATPNKSNKKNPSGEATSSSDKSVLSDQPIPDMTGVLSTDFSAADNQSALQAQQNDLDALKEEVKKLTLVKSQQTKEQGQQEDKEAQKIEELEGQIQELKKAKELKKSSSEDRPTKAFKRPYSNLNSDQDNYYTGVSTTEFDYGATEEEQAASIMTSDNYVPAGTFARAVLLSGADANASVNAQGDTSPIELRILDRGTLPNNRHTRLKGCFVIASTYGDISSERGEVRLQQLSCVRQDNTILTLPVEGAVYGMGGKEGIRGTPVMRNGSVLFYAGVSGLLSGIGSAMQQAQTTQSVSPLGSTTTVDTSKILPYGAYGGANTALSKLADYYIKRADQYHPIIQIGAGSQVDIMFQKGFWLNPPPDGSAQAGTANANTHHDINQQNTLVSDTADGLPDGFKDHVMQQIQHAQLGQTLS